MALAKPLAANAALERHSLVELRRTLVRRLALALTVLTGAWLLGTVTFPDASTVALVTVLDLALVVAYALAHRHAHAAAVLLIASLLTGIATLAAFPLTDAAWLLLPLPVVLAGLLLGPVSGVCLALGAIAALLVWRPLATADLNLTCLGLSVAGAFAAFGLHPLYAETRLAWLATAEMARLTRELRQRQGELAGALKTLRLTNRLLQSTNRELEIARREADEARQLKAEFAASISHELRTPLSVILGFTEIMTLTPEVYGDLTPFRKLVRDIGEVRRAARYLADLVDDILDLARIDALKMPIHREWDDVAAAIEEAASTVRHVLEGKPVSLVSEVPSDLPRLLFDRHRIGQVVLNLLANAARFTPRGSIRIGAELQAGEVLITVRDTGAGIPAEQLEHIFDEFYQLGSAEGQGGGKGLGLAIARRIAQLHDGRLWCESQLGRGTTFSLTLPLAPRNTSRLRRGSEAGLPPDPFPPAVVVLDESPLAAAYLRRQLDNYDVHWATEVQQLAELVAQHRPLALIVNQPLGAGPEQLPALPGVPVICTSLPSDGWLRHDERFDGYLPKPVSPTDLATLARRLAPQGQVLIVDDDRSFTSFVRRALEPALESGHVHCAQDAETALLLARKLRPVLVFLDVALPGPDGFAIAEALRRELPGPGLSIVAVTGVSMGETALATQGERLSVQLDRSFEGDELPSLLQAVLGSVRPRYA